MIKTREQVFAAACTLSAYDVPLFMLTRRLPEPMQGKYCRNGVHVIDVGEDFDASLIFHPVKNHTRAVETGRSTTGILQPRTDGWLTYYKFLLWNMARRRRARRHRVVASSRRPRRGVVVASSRRRRGDVCRRATRRGLAASRAFGRSIPRLTSRAGPRLLSRSSRRPRTLAARARAQTDPAQ